MLKLINLDQMDLFNTKLVKVNKKLEFFNESLTVLNVKRVFTSKPNSGITKLYNEIELSTPKQTKIKDVEFIGQISFKDDIKKIVTYQEEINLTELVSDNMNCQHCNIKRYRNIYNVFMVKGKLKIIGSSCSEKFFGLDIDNLLSIYDSFYQSLDKDDFKTGKDYYSLDQIIKSVNIATAQYKTPWIKMETMDLIKGVLFSNLTDKVEIEETKTKLIDKYSNIDVSNNFNFNIYNILFENNELREYYTLSNIGLACWSIWKINQIELIISNDSRFIGDIKEKITFTAEITNYVIFDGDYGQQALICFTDTDNNEYKSYTACSTKLFDSIEINKSYNFKATVKGHKKEVDYKTKNEVERTFLTRVSIVK
jgi:hypothetical protein